jgi:hypothetical protein
MLFDLGSLAQIGSCPNEVLDHHSLMIFGVVRVLHKILFFDELSERVFNSSQTLL